MDKKSYSSVAETLRNERVKRHWTLKEAGGRIGIGVVFLSEIERGLKVPSALVIHDISKVYELEETSLALAYGRTPISVEETLRERKDVLDAIYQIKNTNKLTEEEKDELFSGIVEMLKEQFEKKEGE